MSFPQKITSGFDFNEAIAMAELSRRAYRVFEFERGREIGELYNAIYNDEWEFAHSMSDYESDGRLLILKRKSKNQFAVVFRGSIVTGGGLELTGMEENEEFGFVEYPLIPFDKNPPPRNVRVYQGMLKGFEAFRQQLELFFNILISPKLDQNLLVDLLDPDDQKAISLTETMINAFSIRNNLDNKIRVDMLTQMSCKLKEFHGNPFNSKHDRVEDLMNYMKRYLTNHEIVKDDQKNIYNESEVYFTGHSRGGTLATFAVLHLKRYWESKEQNLSVKMYSMASTKIGNKSFVNYYNENMKGFSYRVQNLMDPVIYMPTPFVVPFPYNLSLMISGIDYVRKGDLYYAYYEHVGEAYTVFGLGHQQFNLNFGGALNFTIAVPFPHGPDGYKKMLIEARERQQKALMTFQNFFNVIFEKQRDAMLSLDRKIFDIQKSLDNLQNQKEQEVL